MKIVSATAHQFNSLPGHITIAGRGTGTSVAIAAGRALDAIFGDARLYHKRIETFKVTFAVTEGVDS